MKAIHFTLPAWFLVLLMASCNSGTDNKSIDYQLLSPEDFSKTLQEEGILLVDVRTYEEYQAGFIEGAVNIDFKKNDFTQKMGYIGREIPVALYCRKGGRSAKAAEKLEELGFSKIYDLKGGYNAWQAANLSPDETHQ